MKDIVGAMDEQLAAFKVLGAGDEVATWLVKKVLGTYIAKKNASSEPLRARNSN